MTNSPKPPSNAFQHKRHGKDSKKSPELIWLTRKEGKMILNVCFAVEEYETPKGKLFKEQARIIKNKLQPLV